MVTEGLVAVFVVVDLVVVLMVVIADDCRSGGNRCW